MLEQLEQVFPEEALAAAEREVEGAGPGHVVQESRQLSRRQLRPLLDHPVAMDATLVAAHGEVDVDGERDAPPHALLKQPIDQVRHRARAQDLGKAPQPPPPPTFMQARAVVSKTSWLRISGGSYFRLP